MTYTVTFIHTDGSNQVSRYFETVKAARKWIKWMLQQSFVTEVSLYRGNAGEELIERNSK